ncbi:SDR family oxidoreductase, partial [Clostridioides difficile]|nr:SDR family oxidoreductase [Clostridioides difficile]
MTNNPITIDDLAIAESFLKNGAKVTFSDINQESLNNTITELQKKGYDCMSVKCDVTKE